MVLMPTDCVRSEDFGRWKCLPSLRRKLLGDKPIGLGAIGGGKQMALKANLFQDFK